MKINFTLSITRFRLGLTGCLLLVFGFAHSQNIPGTIQAEDYDNGGQNTGYFDNTTGNQGGAGTRADDVDLEACSEGGFNVSNIAVGEWLRYTINVAATGKYDLVLRTAAAGTQGGISIEIDGVAVTGDLLIPNTKGWQLFSSTKISYLSLTEGQHLLKVKATGLNFNFNWFSLTRNTGAEIPNGGLLHTSGKNIVNDAGNYMLKGMGLGNWMLQEGYMMNTGSSAPSQHEYKAKVKTLIGATNTEIFYQRWRDNYYTKKDIDSLKKWGFNSARMPLHYNLFTPLDTADAYKETGFTYIDSAISWCRANDMYLVIDMHAAPGGQSRDNIADYDPANQTLWENVDYRIKLVRLWKYIAQRYANENVIAGYDVINETAFNINNGTLLRNLYGDITTAVRQADKRHILYFEGNWYGNDFTGLTPPWDNNMVYSFHKYWNETNAGSLSFVTDIRNRYNVPLWCGEFGENSNQWMAEVIETYRNNNIGWCGWPVKKIETVSALASVNQSGSYQSLTNYWSGNGNAPSAASAFTTLLGLTDAALITNCRIERDFIDAMNRAGNTTATVPFKNVTLPARINAVEYDMGRDNYAYHDVVSQNSSNNAGTAYNNGYSYRNDGVDIEWSNSAGWFDVGWTEDGEWLNYTVNSRGEGTYTLRLRHSGNAGKMTVKVDGVAVLSNLALPQTANYSTWITTNLGTFLMRTGQHTVQLNIVKAGYNIHYLDFSNFVGVNKPLLANTLNVYPNPATDRLLINTDKPVSAGCNIALYSLEGKLMQSSGPLNTDFSNDYELNVAEVPTGLYLLKLETISGTMVRKVSIAR
ncbi:MAG: carbohydrate-binding protein [Bacteroidota bacterium]